MINATGLYNEVLNGILDRIPGGREIHQQMVQDAGRRASNAAASQAVSGNAVDANRQASLPAVNRNAGNGDGIRNVPFSSLMEHFADGGDTQGLVRRAIEAEIDDAALRHNLDANLVRAVIRAESGYRPDVVSSAGAMGLMQLMPGTAASLGVTDPFDIRQNIDAGTRYLRRMLDTFDGDLELALAAYNAGAGAVRRHGGIPPFRETMNYVPRVQGYMERYALAQYQQAAEDSRGL